MAMAVLVETLRWYCASTPPKETGYYIVKTESGEVTRAHYNPEHPAWLGVSYSEVKMWSKPEGVGT